MAEKEDYIVISKKDFDYKKGHYVTHLAKQMTRQDAIKRMAKAICNMGDEETWGRVDDNYKHYCTAQAEWALNALLSKED